MMLSSWMLIWGWCLITSQSPTTFELTDTDRVVFFGDTTVQEQRFSLYVETFVRVRYPELKTTFFNLGLKNQTTEDALERVNSELKLLSPTIVVVSLGVYDNRPPEPGHDHLAEFRTQYAQLLDSIAALPAKIIVLTPPQPQGPPVSPNGSGPAPIETLGSYVQVVKEVSQAKSARVIDWFQLSQDTHSLEKKWAEKSNTRMRSGLMPSPLSHAVVAAELLKLWKAEPIQVQINVDLEAKQAVSSSGIVSIKSATDQELVLLFKELPMPWPLPRVRFPAGQEEHWPGNELCQYHLVVKNGPQHGWQLAGRPDAIVYSPEQMAAGINISGMQPLQLSQSLRTLTQYIERRHDYTQKYWRDTKPRRPTEPELQEAFESHLRTLQLYEEGVQQVILRLSKTIDTALTFKAPSEAAGTTQPTEPPAEEGAVEP
ncbi:MAG: hypothetical protein HJJLKODD_02005 [Phycisphaerae bacterium]|nr:hypothetical protein [Phycisphaerae bacterium]